MLKCEKIIPQKIKFKRGPDFDIYQKFKRYWIEIDEIKYSGGLSCYKCNKEGGYLDIYSGFVGVKNKEEAKSWLKNHCYKIIYHDGSVGYRFACTNKQGQIMTFNGPDNGLNPVKVNLR